MLAALGLLVLVEAVGLAALPLTALVLGRLPGAGLGFAKVFGLLLVTWLVWMAASLGIVDYGVPLIVGVLVLFWFPETARRELEELNPEDPALPASVTPVPPPIG
jgi:hypothetical protein